MDDSTLVTHLGLILEDVDALEQDEEDFPEVIARMRIRLARVTSILDGPLEDRTITEASKDVLQLATHLEPQVDAEGHVFVRRMENAIDYALRRIG
jgi:hypothetical protein